MILDYQFNLLSVVFSGMSLVCLLAGISFLIFNVYLLKSKWRKEWDLLIAEDDDGKKMALDSLNLTRRNNKFLYVIFFTLALLFYAGDVYIEDGGLPFDFLAFCVTVAVNVCFTLVAVTVERHLQERKRVVSIYTESVLGCISMILWVATLFFFFYMFPWLGFLVAVILCSVGLWMLKVL